MLLPRFLTALVGAPLLLLAIWWGQVPFFVLMFGVTMLALQEYYDLAQEAAWPVSKGIGLVLGALFYLLIALLGTGMFGIGQEKFSSSAQWFLPIFISFQTIFLAVFLLLNRQNKQQAFLNFALTFLGLFYVVWTLSHLVLVRDLRPDGMQYTFFLFGIIWVLDIGAYFGGKKFGKHPLSSISPKKTWEGTIVGSALALVAAFILRSLILREYPVHQILILAIVVIGLAQLSDLSESLFKRNVGVKDSGQLLPGHGGILDRFDSFLLTVPVYYYMLVCYIHK